MCLILLDIRTVNGFPVVLGANREEQYARQSAAPAWRANPHVFAGTDLRAGGTWLGISAGGLVVAVTNRSEPWQGRHEPRSRGQLCIGALRHANAERALTWACDQLQSAPCRPCNLIIADARLAGIVQHTDAPRRRDLQPGAYVITDTDIDNSDNPRAVRARQLTAREPTPNIEPRLAQMARILADRDRHAPPEQQICRHGDTSGTVSSALLAIPQTHLQTAIYRYAPGAPDVHAYTDLSSDLRHHAGG